MPREPKPHIADQDFDGMLARALALSSEAVTVSRLERALPAGYWGDRDRVLQALGRLVRGGTVFRWPGARSGWATRPHEEWVRARVLALLGEAPLTAGELKSRLPTAARKAAPRLLKQLIADGTVHAHPRQGRRRPFSTRPADALASVQPELEALMAAVVKRGLSAASVREAIARWAGAAPPPPAPTQDPGEAILAAMRELNPQVAHGAVVYLPHLRAALRDRFSEKVPFDRAVLALLEQRRVQMQAHPVPSQLKPEERASMIEDGAGSWYMGIGLRV